MRNQILCILWIWALTSHSGWSRDLGARISRIIGEYQAILLCAEGDKAWDIAHDLLAYPDTAVVFTEQGPLPAAEFLLTRACENEKRPLFARVGEMILPTTAPTPDMRNQDHRNQMLAIVAQATTTYAAENRSKRPSFISEQRWKEVLKGAWFDYRLDEEPSWTLICYTYYYREIPAPLDDIAARIGAMVEMLTTPEINVPTACEGSHVLHALALFVKSPCADGISKELRAKVIARLDTKAAEALRQVSLEARTSSGSSLTPLERDLVLLHSYGHTLEWLVEYLPKSRLDELPLRDMVGLLCDLLRDLKGFRLTNKGSICHAVRGLRRYSERVTTRE